MTTNLTLETPDVTLAYYAREPSPPTTYRPLLMVGAPMGASGFDTLAGHFADRTVVTYDPRGLGRSVRHDGSTAQTPEQNAEDIHHIIQALGAGPVDAFASSGGAVGALALVATHPDDVATLVAHEPPLLAAIPDAERAFAAERRIHQAYHDKGSAHGMAAFIAFTSWRGEFTDEFLAAPLPDPAAFGMPAEDDGSRDDPLLSGVSDGITAYRPDAQALADAPTRVLIAVGIESAGTLTGRTSEATARALGREGVRFPSHHGGFLGGEFGQRGEPEAFAARLREVLGDGRD